MPKTSRNDFVGVANYKVGGVLKVGVTLPLPKSLMGRGVRQEGGILQRLRMINKSITNFRFLEIPGEKISTPRICSISTQFSTKFPHSASLRVEKMWKNCVDKEQILSVEIVSPSFSRKLQWLLIFQSMVFLETVLEQFC